MAQKFLILCSTQDFSNKGMKKNHVTEHDREEEEETLYHSRAIMYRLVSEISPWIEKQASLGEWDEKKGKIKMCLMKGKHWTKLGHRENSSHYIYPEEALFLIDRGLLKLHYPNGEASFSKEMAYSVLIGQGYLSIDMFQVYMYLKRLGYILFRCSENSLFHYRIYKPHSTSSFRKSLPGSPSFYLSIQR
jgi:hypothetical protein